MKDSTAIIIGIVVLYLLSKQTSTGNPPMQVCQYTDGSALYIPVPGICPALNNDSPLIPSI